MAGYSYSYSQSGLPGVSQIAEQLMQAQYAWGQQQFAQNSALTDQVVGDLLNLYGNLSGLGSQLMTEYSNYFVPEYQNLVQDANNYASQARIQQAMGAAESGVAQGFNGQRNAALADLQSFGIDPSSGRYAQLDQAERTQQAAAQAGAGFQAEQATEATGRALRSEALQLGSVMPSQATAAYNAAQGAATAGENAKLANSQEGVNMMGSPTQWGALAQQLRTATSSSGQGAGGGGKHPEDKISGSDQGHPTPSNTATSFNPQGTQSGMQQGAQGTGSSPAPPGPYIQSGGGDNSNPIDMGPGTAYDPGGTDNWGPNGENLNTGPAVPVSTDNPLGSVPPGGNDAGVYDNGPSPTNPLSASDTSTSQTPGGSGDMSQGGVDTTSQDTSSSSGGDYSSGGEITNRGAAYQGPQSGGVRMPEHAGAIPYSKSPSHGRVTDDVHAKLNDTGEPIRLNAGEFVMPRHTVAWKGEEYFQKLIEKSKKAREGAGAKPTMKPALPHRGAIPMGAHHG